MQLASIEGPLTTTFGCTTHNGGDKDGGGGEGEGDNIWQWC